MTTTSVPPPPKTHKRVLPPSFSQNYNSNDLSAGPRTPIQKKTRSINNDPFEHNEQIAFPQPHEHTQNTSANSISSNPREFSSVSYKVLPSQNNDSCPKPDASTSTHPSASNYSSSSTNIYASTRRTPGVQLSREQEAVLQFVDRGESIFYTGSAGTGKSVLMREIIAMLRSKYSDEQVAITAPTGIAASNIGGVTLHAFAGVGLAAEPAPKLVGMIKHNRKTFNRWKSTRVLIIDEISMVDGAFFDKLEDIARHVRDIQRPFGGIQLIICGDFMQLPPVSKNNSALFAFEAKTWKDCIQRTILLKEVFRQKDPAFIKVLNEIRLGLVSPESEALMQSLSRNLPPNEMGLVPTELFALRNEVDTCNRLHLSRLPGETHTFQATHHGDPLFFDKFKDCMAPETLDLKIGAQVMLIKNKFTVGLVNGSMGRVIGFEEATGCPVVDFFEGPRGFVVGVDDWKYEVNRSVKATREQVPLLLAYALSIHKSQGQTLSLLRVDLGRVFEKGQSYVALSRAVSLEGLQVLNFRKDKVVAHSKVIQFNRELLTL